MIIFVKKYEIDFHFLVFQNPQVTKRCSRGERRRRLSEGQVNKYKETEELLDALPQAKELSAGREYDADLNRTYVV